MAQAVKTVKFPFTTLLTTLATNTTLGTATVHTFSAITVQLPESLKTMRSVVLRVTARDAAPTTARRLDGVRIGVQIDAVAFNDLDWTGTGITATGDHFSCYADRDVTSYFVTNYTGTSHTVGARVAFETDVADVVNNITCQLIITYEYDDSSTNHVKTVAIPLEGATGFVSTIANADFRGSTGAAQIPALNSFLPESTKTIDFIWFEIQATDSGNSITNFNINYSIDAGITATRATLEQGLNTSVRFYDLWPTTFDTSISHDFEAWSSLASTFERITVTMYVTYRFDASATTTVLNSILLPINCHEGTLNNSTAVNQDVFETTFWIEEPTTITMVQSGLHLVFDTGVADTLTVAVSGHDAAGGSQGTTTSAYTVSARVDSGTKMLQHRIDVAHGGTAITLGRGKNTLRFKIFGSTVVNIYNLGGYFILNYTSGKSSTGIGSHNQTTEWQRSTVQNAFSTTSGIVIGTAEQRTPNIPQTNYYLNAVIHHLEGNASSTSFTTLFAAIESGEGPADGWARLGSLIRAGDAKYGHNTSFFTNDMDNWKRYPNDQNPKKFMNIETARVFRIYGFYIIHDSLRTVLTHHSLTFEVGGTISGSAGGTVNIALLDATTFEVLDKTTRSGNGIYTFNWYDSTRDVIVAAWESDTLKGASKQATPAIDFDISLAASSSATVGGRIMIS